MRSDIYRQGKYAWSREPAGMDWAELYVLQLGCGLIFQPSGIHSGIKYIKTEENGVSMTGKSSSFTCLSYARDVKQKVNATISVSGRPAPRLRSHSRKHPNAKQLNFKQKQQAKQSTHFSISPGKEAAIPPRPFHQIVFRYVEQERVSVEGAGS
jgi:hypothetical protein